MFYSTSSSNHANLDFLSFSTVDENFEVPFVGFCGHAGHTREKKYLLFSSREAEILPPSGTEQAKVSAWKSFCKI